MGNVSKAQRKSANKWDAQHMGSLSCKIMAEEAKAFRDYAEERETTVNALLSGYVRRCLAEDKAARHTESGG